MIKTQFKEIVVLLRNTYRQQKFMTESSEWDAWYECLNDLQFEWLKPAAIQWIQENNFPPHNRRVAGPVPQNKGAVKVAVREVENGRER